MVSDNEIRNNLTYRLDKQLLYLRDEESACTVFETFITTKINFARSNPTTIVSSVLRILGTFITAKDARLSDFAQNAQRTEEMIPWCQSHDFLKVPCDGWKDLPVGVRVLMHGSKEILWKFIRGVSETRAWDGQARNGIEDSELCRF
jgi:hypothetical protein